MADLTVSSAGSEKRCDTCGSWVEVDGYVSIPPGKRLGRCECKFSRDDGKVPFAFIHDDGYSRPDSGADCSYWTERR